MKLLGWIVAVPVAAVVLLIVARLMLCKPDREVVKVATPMVEKIAEYIVQNGVPDSLESVPNLPYRLEGCKRSTTYEKEVDLQEVRTQSENDADWVIYRDVCHFVYESKEYSVKLWFVENRKYPDRTYGKIQVVFKKTSVGTVIELDDNKKLKYEKIGSGFDNRTGFCRQLKQ